MVFSTIEFIAFFLVITAAGYYNPFIRSRAFRNGWLTFASLFFYAWGEPVYVFLLLFSILFNWGAGLLMDRLKGRLFLRRLAFCTALAADLLILFLFKYLDFFLHNLNRILHTDLHSPLILPIGISFYTFQIISYIADLYREKVPVQSSLLKLALYISMFPQLIAGPVVRYGSIANEIEDRRETVDDFVSGLFRFIYGMGKKVLIANHIALLADLVFSLDTVSVCSAWLGSLAYTLQIYFDFSGYSDMAIGLGRMFGFHIEENFNYPYTAGSVTDFWRRWHISLSSWFRDYVYIPLGGNRVSEGRRVTNLFAVWFLTGLWHGANWTFILWGLLYFAALTAEKYVVPKKLPSLLRRLYTLLIVNFLWVLFRSESITAAVRYWGRMAGIGASGFFDAAAVNYLASYSFWLIPGILLSTPLFPRLTGGRGADAPGLFNPLLAAGIFTLSLICILSGGYDPFIYFNF